MSPDGKTVCPFSTVEGKPQASPSRLGVTEDRTTACFTDLYNGSGSGVVRSPDSRSNTR
ncbi:hypothetical protein GK3305 [Geobacillus kaustophilus HTA426]|uniref:Uncharacterized protein n=1 Tax=Geobacillus kaustophilus (strain HTA426) TaxID=235909 RepID=Q5KUP6_GEOKA|nr:hypothetical protein GK3305 [Geobacillus kaustophilus HTA426]